MPFSEPSTHGSRKPGKRPSAFHATRSSPTYLRLLGYFQTHLTATGKDAADALGMSRETVGRYVKLIREDWGGPAPVFLLDPESIEMRLRNLERAVSRLGAFA